MVEGATAFFVVWEDTPDDWIARFEKCDDFPARAWAENMARVYNRRLTIPNTSLHDAPATGSDTHHTPT